MKTRRIFVRAEQISEGLVLFSAKDSHYLKSVLRLSTGDSVRVFDGTSEYAVLLDEENTGNLTGHVVEVSRQTEEANRIEVTLAFGCVRPGPLSEILRHGTELGVSRFVPLLSRRVARRPTEKKERWEAIVKSAAEQCSRVHVPQVEAPVTLEKFLSRDWSSQARLMLSPGAHAVPLLEVLERQRPREAILLVGPEGGFDTDEEAQALRTGFVAVTLGSYILRTETAAFVASGVLAAWHAWRSGGDTASPPGSAIFLPQDPVH